eukprot:UN27035
MKSRWKLLLQLLPVFGLFLQSVETGLAFLFLFKRSEFCCLTLFQCLVRGFHFNLIFRPAKSTDEPTFVLRDKRAFLPSIQSILITRRKLRNFHAFLNAETLKLATMGNFRNNERFKVPKSAPRLAFRMRIQSHGYGFAFALDICAMKSGESHITPLTQLVLLQIEFSNDRLSKEVLKGAEKFLNSNSGAQDRGNRKGKLFWKFDSNAARPGSFLQLLAVFINV